MTPLSGTSMFDAGFEAAYRFEDFFVLRSPLLPFDEMLTWQQHSAGSQPADLQTQRARGASYLRRAFGRPELREALFLASPAAHESLTRPPRDDGGRKRDRLDRTLARYFSRMASRSTPFGLFAGYSVGRVAGRTSLDVSPRVTYGRHSRLDYEYLDAVVAHLSREPQVRASVSFFPNSTIYQLGGQLRYAEAQRGVRGRTYHLCAVTATPFLKAILKRAADGATMTELADSVMEVDATLDRDEALAFVDELIDSQLLVSELTVPVTGCEGADALVAVLARRQVAAGGAAALRDVGTTLRALDQAGLGRPVEVYEGIIDRAAHSGVTPSASRLLQVDLIKGGEPTLGPDVLEHIARGVRVLLAVGGATYADPLKEFRQAFVARYERAKVPLVEALDEESGFAAVAGFSAEASPFVAGLPTQRNPSVEKTNVEEWLLQRLIGPTGRLELTLTDHDVTALARDMRVRGVPDAFSALCSIATTGAERRVLMRAVVGPSGARLLGRFCHGDTELTERVMRHLQNEQALRPDAVFAEVVSLPEGRLGNIQVRPRLREYEISYLGRGAATGTYRIALDDLSLYVEADRFVLWSERLGREVIPRLTTAHNFSSGFGAYRFLCLLQTQELPAAFAWTWGRLASLPFLPRVSVGSVVLARAQWRIAQPQIHEMEIGDADARWHAVQAWRAGERVPRWIQLVEGDNELTVDLDNPLSVDMFTDLLAGQSVATIVEMFPEPSELAAAGADGRFTHEVVIPAVRAVAAPRPVARFVRKCGERPRHLIGSEWLYLKVYGGQFGTDRVLRDSLVPLASALEREGAVDKWFFIRYADPDWHLRFRLHVPERGSIPALLGRCTAALDDALRLKVVRSVTVDEYEPEVDRYGGAAGLAIAETLFHIDSVFVGSVLSLNGGPAPDDRWQIAFVGLHQWLDMIEWDLAARIRFLEESRAGLAGETKALTSALRDKYREYRVAASALLDPHVGLRAGAMAVPFERREVSSRAVFNELARLQEERLLTASLFDVLGSLLHLHVNRLVRSSPLQHEFVLYDFLSRTYRSSEARRRQAAAT